MEDIAEPGLVLLHDACLQRCSGHGLRALGAGDAAAAVDVVARCIIRRNIIVPERRGSIFGEP